MDTETTICGAEPCWELCCCDPDKDADGYAEYIRFAVEREEGREYACHLPAGHTGPHQWTLEDAQ